MVLLHAAAHNPTGVDPTQAQWDELAEIFAKQSLVPLFDTAYQGFATGDCVRDAYPLRAFDSAVRGQGPPFPCVLSRACLDKVFIDRST